MHFSFHVLSVFKMTWSQNEPTESQTKHLQLISTLKRVMDFSCFYLCCLIVTWWTIHTLWNGKQNIYMSPLFTNYMLKKSEPICNVKMAMPLLSLVYLSTGYFLQLSDGSFWLKASMTTDKKLPQKVLVSRTEHFHTYVANWMSYDVFNFEKLAFFCV